MGVWLDFADDWGRGYRRMRFKCSACGCVHAIPVVHGDTPIYKYCPFCGDKKEEPEQKKEG